MGADRNLPDLPCPVLYLAPHWVFPQRTQGNRGMRHARWVQPVAEHAAHPPAGRGTGCDLRGALRLHAVVERIPLFPGVRLACRAQDDDSRRFLRAHPWRHLLLGFAHGGGLHRFVADRDRLRLLSRLLRFGLDRRSNQITALATRAQAGAPEAIRPAPHMEETTWRNPASPIRAARDGG